MCIPWVKVSLSMNSQHGLEDCKCGYLDRAIVIFSFLFIFYFILFFCEGYIKDTPDAKKLLYRIDRFNLRCPSKELDDSLDMQSY